MNERELKRLDCLLVFDELKQCVCKIEKEACL